MGAAQRGPSANGRTHLHPGFSPQREIVVVVAPRGLGKTMIAKRLVHKAILAGVPRASYPWCLIA
jgi:hypothetical protein